MALNYAAIYFPNGRVSNPSHFQINNLLTSERSFFVLQNLIVSQLFKKCTTFY